MHLNKDKPTEQQKQINKSVEQLSIDSEIVVRS